MDEYQSAAHGSRIPALSKGLFGSDSEQRNTKIIKTQREMFSSKSLRQMMVSSHLLTYNTIVKKKKSSRSSKSSPLKQESWGPFKFSSVNEKFFTNILKNALKEK